VSFLHSEDYFDGTPAFVISVRVRGVGVCVCELSTGHTCWARFAESHFISPYTMVWYLFEAYCLGLGTSPSTHDYLRFEVQC